MWAPQFKQKWVTLSDDFSCQPLQLSNFPALFCFLPFSSSSVIFSTENLSPALRLTEIILSHSNTDQQTSFRSKLTSLSSGCELWTTQKQVNDTNPWKSKKVFAIHIMQLTSHKSTPTLYIFKGFNCQALSLKNKTKGPWADNTILWATHPTRRHAIGHGNNQHFLINKSLQS